MPDDYITRIVDMIKLEAFMTIIRTQQDLTDEQQHFLCDFLRSLVRNGCPFETIIKTFEDLRKQDEKDEMPAQEQ